MNEELLLSYLKKIEEVWAPELLNVYVSIVQVEAYGHLIFMICMALGTIGFVSLFRKHYPEVDWDASVPDEHGILMIIGVIGGIVTGFVTFFGLFDIWMWVGIFNPRLAAAHQILESIVK